MRIIKQKAVLAAEKPGKSPVPRLPAAPYLANTLRVKASKVLSSSSRQAQRWAKEQSQRIYNATLFRVLHEYFLHIFFTE
ncbi:hypothetical protein [Gibbsiella quercinecans]|uniref:hypothetical protein n=1 Tax=Gibbsiella quercinecans TaxID=929813 RepID=UPI003A4E5CDC